jgi:hypothetical protein
VGATYLGSHASGRGEQAAATPSAVLDTAAQSASEAADQLAEAKPTCVPDARVPTNGEELIRGGRGGDGALKIHNGSDHDAIVALYDEKDDSIVRRLYVHRGMVGQARSIKPGKYSIRVAFGELYSSDRRRFCSFDGATEFDDLFEYPEGGTENSPHYEGETENSPRFRRTWTITLYPVANGNASIHGISPDLVFGDSTSP